MTNVKPTIPKDQQTYPLYIPPNDDKHFTAIRLPDQAIRLLSPREPASIAVHALYHVINLAFNNPPSYTIPRTLNNSSNRFWHNTNIDKVCNSVIHPITKETITKYTKLVDDPALKGLWFLLCPTRNYITLPKGKKVSRLAPIQFSIKHMMKSGASR